MHYREDEAREILRRESMECGVGGNSVGRMTASEAVDWLMHAHKEVEIDLDDEDEADDE